MDVIGNHLLCTYPEGRSVNARLLSGCPKEKERERSVPPGKRTDRRRLNSARKLVARMEEEGWAFELDPEDGAVLTADGRWSPGRSLWVVWARDYAGEIAWILSREGRK